MAAILQLRRGISNASASVLSEGELYLHQGTGSIQFGSGSNTYTLLPLSAPANGNINLSGDISASNLILTGHLTVAQNITFGGELITFGNSGSDNIVINADLSSSIIPNDTNAFDLGASNKKWKNLYAVSASIDSISVPGSGILSSSDTSFATYTGSINDKNLTLANYTTSVDTKFTAVGSSTSSLNSYTQSQDTKNSTLATYTASLDTKNSTLATYTASVDQKFSNIGSQSGSWDNTNLNSFTQSVDTKFTAVGVSTASLNSFTQSQETKNNTLGSYTASIDTKFTAVGSSTASLNSYTQSQDTKNSTLANYTSSLEIYTGSIDTKWSTLLNVTASVLSATSSLNSYTQSIDTKFTAVGSSTASLNSYTQSQDTKNTTLATYTGSNDTKWGTIENVTASVLLYTQSLKDAITVSGLDSTSTTTIKGNLVVQGTQTSINSTAIVLGDNIIELNGTGVANGGLLVKDPTGASQISGSLLWDSTYDYWKAGQLGVESKILLAGGDGIVSSSAQITPLLPSGVVSGSQQVTSSLDNRYLMIEGDSIVSSSAQIVHILNDLNTFSGSQNTKNSTLATYTASIDSHISNLNQATSSYETKGRGIVSGSSQITYTSISSIPSGIISGSSQIDATATTNFNSGIKTKLDAETVVSGSSQIPPLLPTGVVSGSSQVTYSDISSISVGIVSGSAQVTPLLPTGVVSASIQIVYSNVSSIPAGIVSGSSQIPSLLPMGVVSGSQQLTGSYDGRYAPSASFATLLGANTLASLGSAAFYHVSSSIADGNPNTLGNAFAIKQYVDDTLTAVGAGDITGVYSGNGLSGSADSGSATLTLNTGSAHFTNGVDARLTPLTSLNSYTSSQDTKNSTLASYTASIDSHILNLNTATSSYETKGRGIVSGSSQITSSFDLRYLVTGSVTSSIIQLNSFTSSINSKTGSYATTGSNSFNGSQQITGSLVVSQNITGSASASFVSLAVNTTTPTQKIHLKGIVGIEAGTTGGDTADQIIFGYNGSGLTQYNHKIQTGHDAQSALNRMDFLLANSSTTWKTPLQLRPDVINVSGSLIVTGSINGTINATNGVISGSSQINLLLPSGIVSGSSQLSGTTITDLTIVNLTTINETASVIFSSGSNRFGDFSNDTHSFTGSVQISGSLTTIGDVTATSFNGVINATNGVISGSSQLTATLPSGVVSGSSQITYASISSIPAGIISSSAQVDADSITNFDSNVKAKLDAEGVISGSSQVSKTLQEVTTAGASTSNAITISNATASTTKTTGALIVTGGIGVSGDINAGGDIVAFASSDIRLKNNIRPIQSPLEKISKISGCEFDWNADLQTIYSGKDYGVIAQEIEEVFPELVQTRENGYKAVKYDKLVSVLIEGIKELTKQVEYLKTKIEN